MTPAEITGIIGSVSCLSGICCLGVASLVRQWRSEPRIQKTLQHCLDKNIPFEVKEGHLFYEMKVGVEATTSSTTTTAAPIAQTMVQQAPTGPSIPSTFEPFLFAIDPFSIKVTLLSLGVLFLLYTMFVWWRDVLRESTLEGHHTKVVQLGSRFGNVFRSLIHSVARNPSLAKQLFGYAILGFALTEAIALFALMMAFLILSVFQI